MIHFILFSFLPKKISLDPCAIEFVSSEKQQPYTAFSINDLDSVPAYEILNIDARVSGRWLEDKVFLNDDQQKPGTDDCNQLRETEIPVLEKAQCGPLEFMVLQLKLDSSTRYENIHS